MTLPTSGPIAIGQISEELSQPYDSARGLGDATTRVLLEKPSGAISLSDGYGKTASFFLTITNQSNVNIRDAALAAGWNGLDRVIATVDGVVSSTSAATPAMVVNGAFPAGVALNVLPGSYVVGKGGNGGNSASDGLASTPGGNGGLALMAYVPVSINNLGTIGGGGGGGGGAGFSRIGNYQTALYFYGGSGGGGGAGFGGGGSTTSNLIYTYTSVFHGLNGAAGLASTPGTSTAASGQYNVAGGTGGGLGQNGQFGQSGYDGEYGKGTRSNPGKAGPSVAGNSNVTWIAAGSRLGTIYASTTY